MGLARRSDHRSLASVGSGVAPADARYRRPKTPRRTRGRPAVWLRGIALASGRATRGKNLRCALLERKPHATSTTAALRGSVAARRRLSHRSRVSSQTLVLLDREFRVDRLFRNRTWRDRKHRALSQGLAAEGTSSKLHGI